ncbi:MAG: T9SS type A sorting domain-containing protein [Bacteroidia bacterium]|nr:T9SS type A sorting domain-containing protein [Bacteroidia bacterium]
MNSNLHFKVLVVSMFLLCDITSVFAQARIMFGSTATYMRMRGGTLANPIYLVIGNPASNAITYTSGGIISEAENNFVKWNIGNTTGTGYLIPFRNSASPATEDVSIYFDVASAGSPATGYFLASTYGGGNWDNNTFRPSAVTHVGDSIRQNNSKYVIDRFWGVVNEGSYATKPGLNNFTFKYLDSEHSAAGNTITETNLRAQRWNSGNNSWHGWMAGSINTVTNTVTINALTSSDLFRWWTLTDNDSPLPVAFLSFDAKCKPDYSAHNTVEIKWSTATEANSHHFLIERGQSPNDFSTLATIPASGNSSVTQNYQYLDKNPLNQPAFYRITETDVTGNKYSTEALFVTPCSDNTEDVLVYPAEDGLYVFLNVSENRDGNVKLTNSLGQQVLSEQVSLSKGQNTVKFNSENLTCGVYFVTFMNQSKILTKKFLLTPHK